MNRQILCFPLLAGLLLSSGCMAPTAKPDDPYYAPVLPRTPLPAAQNNGSIYQAGFENGLYAVSYTHLDVYKRQDQARADRR